MKDFDNQELMLNRGKYSTVRSAHEDANKTLAKFSGDLISQSTYLVRRMQTEDSVDVDAHIADMRNMLALIESCAKQIQALGDIRAELKPLAWGKGK